MSFKNPNFAPSAASAREGSLKGCDAFRLLKAEGVRRAMSRDDYDEEEMEFLRAVDAFRARTGLRFPDATHYLAILKSLGYRKAE